MSWSGIHQRCGSKSFVLVGRGWGALAVCGLLRSESLYPVFIGDPSKKVGKA